MHISGPGRCQQSKVDVCILFSSLQLQYLLTLGNIGKVTIDMLPDFALLEILDFFLPQNSEAWCTLIHVCRRWRTIAFRSPRRLNLQLICTARTSMRQTLAVWSPLPIFIKDWSRSLANSDVDNILRHSSTTIAYVESCSWVFLVCK